MHVGEQRFVTVAMQNTGDATWPRGGPKLGLTAASAADDFHVEGAVEAMSDDINQRLAGVSRGLPGVFTLLVTAPCQPGTHSFSVQMVDSNGVVFGAPFTTTILIAP
jgi:hypothetical protein